MRLQVGSRDDLVKAFASREPSERGSSIRAVKDLGSISKPPAEEVYLVWREDSGFRPWGIPDAVIVRDEELRDFLAWATTFLGSFNPFTSFMRVVSWGAMRQNLDVPDSVIKRRREGFGDSGLGLVLVETWLRNPQVPVQSLVDFDFHRTLAFAFSRGLYAGYDGGVDPVIQTRWSEAKRLLRLSGEREDRLEDVIGFIWGILDAASISDRHREDKDGRGHQVLIRACQDVRRLGEIRENCLRELVGSAGGGADLFKRLKGSREERVLAVEELERRGLQRLSPVLGDFVLGYLVSRWAPGSLQHLEFLSNELRRRPAAACWYGALSGLHPESEVRDALSGRGRRVLRDLLEDGDDFLARPSCDISFEELKFASFKESVGFRSFRSVIRVELVALVVATYDAEVRPGRQLNLFEGQLDQERLMKRLGRSIRELEEIRRIFGASNGVSNDPKE